MTTAALEQRLPAPGVTGVTRLVIKDLLAREQKGIETYGRTLQTHNGRNALLDAYQELLDGAQYLKQRLLEEDDLSESIAQLGAALALVQAERDYLRLVVETVADVAGKSCEDYPTAACKHAACDGSVSAHVIACEALQFSRGAHVSEYAEATAALREERAGWKANRPGEAVKFRLVYSEPVETCDEHTPRV